MRDGDEPMRVAMTTTTGTSAATEPFGVMKAVSTATSSIVSTSSRRALPPPRTTSSRPSQAVTPPAFRASLTTNRLAMNTTVASPNPANACGRVSTPVAYSVNAAPMATSSTGSRFHTNSTTTTPRTRKLIATGLTRGTRHRPGGARDLGARRHPAAAAQTTPHPNAVTSPDDRVLLTLAW